MFGDSSFSLPPLSFEDLIDDSYLGAPVKKKADEEVAKKVIVPETHTAPEAAESHH